jgi:biotin carboxyl carrier protein
MKSQLIIDRGDGQEPILVEELGPASYRVTVGDERLELDLRRLGRDEYHLLHGLDGHDLLIERSREEGATLVHRGGSSTRVTLLDERRAARAAILGAHAGGARSADGTVAIRAPMPGKVVKALVRAGESVSAGQGVIVIEAMKMENELRSPVDGTVKEIRVLEGQSVEAGEHLVFLE